MSSQGEDRDKQPTSAVECSAERLPIFRVAAKPLDREALASLALDLFGVEEFELRRSGHRLSLRSGTKLVEVDGRSGGIWAADHSQLWRPESRPSLPDSRNAQATARDRLTRGLLPSFERGEPFAIDFLNVGGTFMTTEDGRGRRSDELQLDVQINYGVHLELPIGSRGEMQRVPLVGGGGQFNLTLGDRGAVIGYSGVWRPVQAGVIESPTIPREEADIRFRELTGRLRLESYEARLAYYCAPSPCEAQFLYPVWVYQAVARVGKERVPLRIITLPATRFGPEPRQVPSRVKRTAQRNPPLTALPAVTRATGFSFLNPFTFDPYEAGTSWIGLSGGLAGSQANAQGFVDELADDGWLIDFNWGDANAWESDWRRNDDQWVDGVDFVFYTGHANMDGWVLSSPDDTFLHFSETAGAKDRWGKQDLEWMIIASCGPLQDEVLAKNGGNVFDRWRDAFDGLHTLMGYGAITFDNEEEGRAVVEYARDGTSLIDAWFRAAREIQPSDNGASAPDGPTIYVGAMYAYKSGTTSPRNDHLWGHGSVAADPTNHDVRVCMWTTT